MDGFINYAHRGASQYAPENTLASFYMGWQMGANGIETDIQCTSDGIPVLFHDNNMERIAGLNSRICDLTYEELRVIDVGAHKGADYRGEHVPTLEEFLHHFAGKGLHLALEIKQGGIGEAIVPLIRKYCDPGQTVVTSFHLDYLAEFQKLMPEMRLGFLSGQESMELLEELKAMGLYQYCPNAATWTEKWNRIYREAGFSIRAWGVKDETLMHKMLTMHVDGMTVNFPDKLEAALKEMQQDR